MKFHILNPAMTDRLWPEIKSLIYEASKGANNEYSIEQIKSDAEQGKIVILIIEKDDNIIALHCIGVVSYPNGKRVLTIQASAGSDLGSWLHKFNELLTILASEQDCSEIRIIGRKGWSRVLKDLNWEDKYTVLTREV